MFHVVHVFLGPKLKNQFRLLLSLGGRHPIANPNVYDLVRLNLKNNIQGTQVATKNILFAMSSMMSMNTQSSAIYFFKNILRCWVLWTNFTHQFHFQPTIGYSNEAPMFNEESTYPQGCMHSITHKTLSWYHAFEPQYNPIFGWLDETTSTFADCISHFLCSSTFFAFLYAHLTLVGMFRWSLLSTFEITMSPNLAQN